MAISSGGWRRPSTDRAAVLEEVCLVEGGVTVRTRTKQSKVTRVFRDASAGRCEMLTKGSRKAEHLAAFAQRVAYLKETLALGVRFPAKSGSQVCEHGAKSRQFRGRERRELSSMATFSSRNSAKLE